MSRLSGSPTPLCIGLGCAAILGCSGGADPTEPRPAPGSLAAIGQATDQAGTVGRSVTSPPAVLVTSTVGRPLGGVMVTFRVTEGGGTVSPAT